MIQANELRIGNWIADRGGKQWQIDCWENPTKVAAKPPMYFHEGLGMIPMHPFTEEVEYLQPIPLTEEILLKCDNLIYCNDGYKFSMIEYFLITTDFAIYFEGSFTCVEIKYLHQLQNLYFSLTNEELTFKP